jgi:hypothetical protein
VQRTSNSTARAAVVDILLVKLSKGLTFNHHVDDRALRTKTTLSSDSK